MQSSIPAKSLLLALATGWLIMILGPSAAAQKTGETVKDPSRGISFKVPKDWISIPVDPTDTHTIHKYQADRPDQSKKLGLNHTASLDVIFFPPHASETGAKKDEETEDEKKKNESLLEMMKNIRFKNYEEYYKANIPGAKLEQKPKKKTIKKNAVTYYDLLVERKFVGHDSLFIRYRTCVYHRSDGDFAFQYGCLDEHYKKRHKSSMEASTRSVKFIEKESTAERDKELAGMGANERYIQEQVDKLSKGWYHFYSKNKNYVIFSNADKSFAREIAKALEGIRVCYEKAFPGKPRINWIPIVRVCATKNEYHGYGGPSGSAGYWSDATKEFVFYNDVAQGAKNTILVLKHEAFHHFIHFYLGCRLSTWFDEGCAEYFAGGEFVGRSVKIKQNAWRRGVIQQALVQDKFIPMKKFLHMSKAEYYAQSSLCYAQGWSVLYFLLEGRKQGGRVEKDWATIPQRYIKNLQDAFEALEKEFPDKVTPGEVNYKLADKAVEKAMAKTFDGWTEEDWKRMEKAWIDFTK